MVEIFLIALKVLGLLVCLHLLGSVVSFILISVIFYKACKITGDKFGNSVIGLFVVCLITGWWLIFKLIKKLIR